MSRFDGESGPGPLAALLVLSASVVTALAIVFTALDLAEGGDRALKTPPREDGAGIDAAFVRRSLQAAGFATVENIRRRGPNFTAEATTRTGGAARIVISGTTGALLGIRFVERNGSLALTETSRK